MDVASGSKRAFLRPCEGPGSTPQAGGRRAVTVCNSAAVPGYQSTHLSHLERIPLDHGVWQPIRRPLAITGFAVNAYSAEAGQPVIEPHDETSAGAGAHQELYLVASGAATFTVAGEAVEAPAGTLVVVEPGVMRDGGGGAGGATREVVGGRPDSAMPPSPFEFWYAALPAERAGDLERAHEIVAEGLEQWPEHGTIHYVLGSLCARMGRRDEALRHLRIAFANDRRTREWAAEDDELDAVRDALYGELGS
jgi:tetratricopeptide (TPR) repeat protein